MPPSTPKTLASLYVSLIVTTVLTAVLVIATIWLDARSNSEDSWVRHTLGVRNQISEVLNLLQYAETSERGFLLTGTDIFVASFDRAVAAVPAATDELTKLTSDNPRQQRALGELLPNVKEKIRLMRENVATRRAGQGPAAAATVDAGEGRRLMLRIREILSNMGAEERRLQALRETSAEHSSLLLRIGAALTFLLICVLGAVSSYVTRRSFTELANTRDRLITSNNDLLEQVSRREQVESQLRQAQKMEAVGQLTGGIAHDFNNMLGVIGGSLELMQRRIKKGDFAIERFLEAALKAMQRAATLTHHLLAFSRQQPLAPEIIDANRMIADMSDLLRSTLGEHIRIEVVSAAGLWHSHADSHQLESALLNIAINARDAMPDGGKLTIETANAYLDDAYCRQQVDVTPGQYVLIAVTDTGGGMKPEIVARAFDPFFTTKATGKGTGLGLSQVYGFVKQSKGHIKIYSEVGAGTTAKLYLPRIADGVPQVERRRPQPALVGQSSEVILVVEDDHLMRHLTAASLMELGYTVLDSDGAADALAVLSSRPDITLLFTDVVMPDVNGKKLAEEAQRTRPDLKVLFTTGYTPNAVVHGGVLDAGVNFLSKPFTIEQLAAKVRAVLDQ
ncbi:MAG TPA: CHASE3 domain-containing protein [Pseudolabrys sp.]|nr:CHASE3 domain-containing protein [Pseudolabrys sp.]